ncbi:MAG: hypothetical protein J4473_04485 [Candidatus Aenigmarchaeota archaeon]|nr:hypothetical protein [Candidatus Aenigmarchaeota archaeon]
MTFVFKTLKFRIFQPRSGKSEAFDELSEEFSKGVNHCFSITKGHDIENRELLNHMIYSENSDYSLQKVCNLPSAMKQTARDKALEIYKSHKRKQGRSPEISQVPVVLDRRTFSLKKRDGFFRWFVGITTNHGKKYVPLHVVRQYRYPAKHLPQILNGELPIVKAELLKKNNECWIHIIVRIKIEKKNPGKPRAFYGIDLGEKRLATCVSLR